MAQSTPYILLDGPTAHLDIGYKYQIMNMLANIKEQGKCVISVLHDLDLALKFSDEIILINNGRIIFTGSPKDVIDSGKIDEAFGIK